VEIQAGETTMSSCAAERRGLQLEMDQTETRQHSNHGQLQTKKFHGNNITNYKDRFYTSSNSYQATWRTFVTQGPKTRRLSFLACLLNHILHCICFKIIFTVFYF